MRYSNNHNFTMNQISTNNADCKGNMYIIIMQIASNILASPGELHFFATDIWKAIYNDLAFLNPLFVGISEDGYSICVREFDKDKYYKDMRWFYIDIEQNDYVHYDEISIKVNHQVKTMKLEGLFRDFYQIDKAEFSNYEWRIPYGKNGENITLVLFHSEDEGDSEYHFSIRNIVNDEIANEINVDAVKISALMEEELPFN